jgi:ubiquinone/menaquinone biosynthesis C-methylase UbiE
VEKKLQRYPELRGRATLTFLETNTTRLPYADETFDYVVCLSVLSLLGSRERAGCLVQEFSRIMKPGAKMLVDINGQTSEFATKGRAIGNDIFEFPLNPGDPPVPTYCPRDEAAFRALLQPFVIDDVGFAAHRYLKSAIFEYIACVRKPDNGQTRAGGGGAP